MTQEKLEKEIVDYISKHRMCTIATARDNQPSASTVYYINEGLEVFFESDPLTEKVKTIEVNPKVALTIDDDQEDWSKIKGVQLYGNAEAAPKSREKHLTEMLYQKFPSIKKLGGIPGHHIFIRVKTEKVYFLDYAREFGYRAILHVENRKSIIRWG